MAIAGNLLHLPFAQKDLKVLLRIFSLLLLCASALPLSAQQLGGAQSFAFTQLRMNALEAGMGGMNLTGSAHETALFIGSPAMLTDSLHQQLSVSAMGLMPETFLSQAAYAHSFRPGATWGVALRQFSFGKMDAYDINGNFTGTFSANDFALTVGHARRFGDFSVGANLNLVQSQIAGFGASGILLDMGGAFLHPTKDLRIAWAVTGVGGALSYYTPEAAFEMPLDVRLGMSFKPQKMPFRLSFTLQRLHQFLNITYNEPQEGGGGFLGQEEPDQPSFADKLSRHFVVGGEFVLGKRLDVRMGYNFLHRRELTVEQRTGIAGFSFGVMLKLNNLRVGYGRGQYHLAAASHTFTLQLDMRSIFRKNKTID